MFLNDLVEARPQDLLRAMKATGNKSALRSWKMPLLLGKGYCDPHGIGVGRIVEVAGHFALGLGPRYLRSNGSAVHNM